MATKKGLSPKRTGAKKASSVKVIKRSKPRPKAKPKRKPAPEPRKAQAPISSDQHDESARAVTKNYDPTVGEVVNGNNGEATAVVDEEVEAVGDGTEDGDAEPPELDDEDDDEGYF